MRCSELSEDQRKALVLGLAHLALELPQWSAWLRILAAQLDGGGEFDEWVNYSRDCQDETLRQSALAALFADVRNAHHEES